MPAQYWESMLNPLQAANNPAAVAYNTSVTLTDVSPGAASNASFVMPANTLTIGSALRLTASGTFSNTATPTLLLGFYYGAVAGVSLASSLATTTTTAAVSWPWRLEYTGVVRSVGTAGSIMGGGVLYLATSLTTFAVIPIPGTAQATVAIDTTTAKAITVGGQWGTSSASNTLLCNHFLLELMS